jgi:hypothetical protein
MICKKKKKVLIAVGFDYIDCFYCKVITQIVRRLCPDLTNIKFLDRCNKNTQHNILQKCFAAKLSHSEERTRRSL